MSEVAQGRNLLAAMGIVCQDGTSRGGPRWRNHPIVAALAAAAEIIDSIFCRLWYFLRCDLPLMLSKDHRFLCQLILIQNVRRNAAKIQPLGNHRIPWRRYLGYKLS